MKWWGWWRNRNGNKAARAAQAEEMLRRTQRMTPRIEALAEAMTLPPDEFAERMARAFRRRT